MDMFFASPEAQICRDLSEACRSVGSRIVPALWGPDPVRLFGDSAARGLTSLPRRLESRFLYDAAGSALFERITLQPEYYLTRTETSILAEHAAAIRKIVGPAAILELGSGSCAKTDHLLRAWLDEGKHAWYLPVDVSMSSLVGTCNRIAARHPRVRVTALNCEYRDAFPVLSQLSPVLVAFLGSSIGNLTRRQTDSLVTSLAAFMRPGDFFLLGVDLVKHCSLLEAAYNDRAGVTAQFTKNVFARMNRELGSCIDLGAIRHTARFNAKKEQIEISACFSREQTFRLTPPGVEVTIGKGEEVQTEISRKYRLEEVINDLEHCGFAMEQVFSDERRWFALLLLRRVPFYSGGNRRR